MKGYDVNFGSVPLAIKRALHDYHTANDDTGPHLPYNGMLHHASRRSFYGVRFAATRADVAGHSMGGQVIRFYVSQLNGTADRTIREDTIGAMSGWERMDFQRHAPEQDSQLPPQLAGKWMYQRDDNFGAGDIRRFVTLGSVFDGNPLGDVVGILLDPASPQEDRVRAVIRVALPAQYERMYPNSPADKPTGPVDLAELSSAQLLMEGEPLSEFDGTGTGAAYPVGPAAVCWRPIAGRLGASDDNMKAWALREIVTMLLHEGFDGIDSELKSRVAAAINPALGDGVVPLGSQLNSDGRPLRLEDIILEEHRHSYRENAPLDKAENGSADIAARILWLLSRPRPGNFEQEGLDK